MESLDDIRLEVGGINLVGEVTVVSCHYLGTSKLILPASNPHKSRRTSKKIRQSSQGPLLHHKPLRLVDAHHLIHFLISPSFSAAAIWDSAERLSLCMALYLVSKMVPAVGPIPM